MCNVLRVVYGTWCVVCCRGVLCVVVVCCECMWCVVYGARRKQRAHVLCCVNFQNYRQC